MKNAKKMTKEVRINGVGGTGGECEKIFLIKKKNYKKKKCVRKTNGLLTTYGDAKMN